MIAVEDLHKRYASVHAVNELSLIANHGEIFGLIGPNGAGKSTTIRMIVNVIQPDAGSITYDGGSFDDNVAASGVIIPQDALDEIDRVLAPVLGQFRGTQPPPKNKREPVA